MSEINFIRDVTLNVPAVADRLGITPRQVRNMLVSGILPGFKRGIRSWGIFLSELEEWLSSRGNEAVKA